MPLPGTQVDGTHLSTLRWFAGRHALGSMKADIGGRSSDHVLTWCGRAVRQCFGSHMPTDVAKTNPRRVFQTVTLPMVWSAPAKLGC